MNLEEQAASLSTAADRACICVEPGFVEFHSQSRTSREMSVPLRICIERVLLQTEAENGMMVFNELGVR